MRIRSTIVDGHTFTRSRRGYDAAEVDAVMARIAATLRTYEDQAEELEARITAAETAAKVARPKPEVTPAAIEAAHAQAAELIKEAETEAAQRRSEITALLEAARKEAEELRVEAERARADTDRARADIEVERAEVATHADAAAMAADAAAEAAHDADLIRSEARKEAESILLAALDEARRLRTAAIADAEEARQVRIVQTEAEIAERRSALEADTAAVREEAERTASALESAEEERAGLERRLDELRGTVRTIETQMRTLAGDVAERAGEIGDIGTVSETGPVDPVSAVRDDDRADALDTADGVGEVDQEFPAAEVQPDEDAEPATGVAVLPLNDALSPFQAPSEDAPLATAEPSAVAVVDDDAFDETESDATYTYTRHHAYAEPDGSGRPPAARATIISDQPADGEPGDDPQDPYRTVYQRAGRNLRARLRQEGQDPTQRGR